VGKKHRKDVIDGKWSKEGMEYTGNEIDGEWKDGADGQFSKVERGRHKK
jgi:hypothetical protein